MKLKIREMMVFVLAMFFMAAPSAQASVIINEIFADPAADLSGDANADGTRSGTQDEFIELLNDGSSEEDISGWKLFDSVSLRHVFPENTGVAPYSFLAIFGGGSPQLTDIDWQVASSGSLGLNNGGDTVSLFDMNGQLVDEVVYGGIGGNDQSITLFPDGEGTEFVLHSGLEESQGALFSPGTSVDSRTSLAFIDENEEEGIPENTVVPEIPTLLYFGLGWGAMFLRRK